MELTCQISAVSAAVEELTVVTCDLESGTGTILLAELDELNVGEHTLKLTLSDTNNAAFTSTSDWSITIVTSAVEEVVTSAVEEVCDPNSLFLTQTEGTWDPLPEKTLEITAGDLPITFSLPVMTIESLDGDQEEVAEQCAPIYYSLIAMDTSGVMLNS